MAKHQLYEISLKSIMKNSQGETLLLAEEDKSEGYDFPGGRIQEGEDDLDLSDILTREILEETGNIQFELAKKPCAIERHTFMHDNNVTKHLIWVFFEAKFLGGDIEISEEHAGYEWVKLEEIELEKYFARAALAGMKNYLGRE